MRTLAILTREGFTSEIVEHDDGRVTFTADADIDADGSPHAYNPKDTGTDYLANAKDGDKWVGVLTDEKGEPISQGDGDLAPGHYISTTRYEWTDQPRGTQRRYVNGDIIPFAVVPPIIINAVAGIVLGCRCTMHNKATGATVEGMVADSGPRTKDGEISPAAAIALGLNSSPKFGGTDEAIIEYTVYPGVPFFLMGHAIPLQRANGEHVFV